MTTDTTAMNDLDLARVAALLDRLDLRMDEPCTVPGCVHVAGACRRGADEPVTLAA